MRTDHSTDHRADHGADYRTDQRTNYSRDSHDLEAIFAAGSVAVVGAGRDPNKAAHQVLRTLVKDGFSGRVYAVHPRETEVLGVKCYRSVAEVPGGLDLVVIGVPASAVLPVVEEAAARGDVKGVVVLSAGFAETGAPELVALQARIVDVARSAGIRVFGPNCIGVMNPATKLSTGFAPGVSLIPGTVGVITQSGALGGALLMLMGDQPQPLGFSKWGHVGNMSDVTNLELLSFLGEDPETRVIAMYMEGVRDGRELMRIAGRITRKKPVLLLKVGRTDVGSSAALSHTGTLAGSDAVYSAAFAQSGIVRVDTLEELVDAAKMIAMAPAPAGNRVCILTEAGGPGIIAMDEVGSDRSELVLAPVSPETEAALTRMLPPMAMVCKPRGYVDMTAAAMAREHGEALKLALADPGVDSVILISLPPTFLPATEVAQAIIGAVNEARAGARPVSERERLTLWPAGKPVVVCFMRGRAMLEARKLLEAAGIPTFDTPEKAARALSNATKAARTISHGDQESDKRGDQKRDKRGDQKPSVEVETKTHRLIQRAAREGRNLLETECYQVLRDYGIPVAESGLASSPEEAAQIAVKLGFPAAMKVVSPQVVHKSDAGGVKLNIMSPAEASDAFRRIVGNVRKSVPEAEVKGVVVARQYSGGTEVIVGMTRDPQFGPVVMFGLGGVYVEVFKDVSFSVAPFDLAQARAMIARTKSRMILAGARGARPRDTEALADLLVKVGMLACQNPEIAEMDLNPVMVFDAGLVVLDARIILSGEPSGSS
ncbi:MAG: acetate--CoA ligase family protein [Syntrophothermus sp.]